MLVWLETLEAHHGERFKFVAEHNGGSDYLPNTHARVVFSEDPAVIGSVNVLKKGIPGRT